MFLRKAALRPVPPYAVVQESFVAELEDDLGEEGEELQEKLDRAYRELDRRQPALAAFLAAELAMGDDELIQSLGYFLSITIYLLFGEAFPRRLREVSEEMIHMASEMLAVDEQLRADDPSEIF
ncbi:MAG: hypothetical protein OEY14_12825, partial [Myxococcales bacterium]|nr:hypothetical protein [Myxococcales bacterium]